MDSTVGRYLESKLAENFWMGEILCKYGDGMKTNCPD